MTDLDCAAAKISTETRSAIDEFAEMLAALERVSIVGADAFTSREVMQATSASERRTVALIRRGVEAGVLRACRKSIRDMAGRIQTVPAYRRVAE